MAVICGCAGFVARCKMVNSRSCVDACSYVCDCYQRRRLRLTKPIFATLYLGVAAERSAFQEVTLRDSTPDPQEDKLNVEG